MRKYIFYSLVFLASCQPDPRQVDLSKVDREIMFKRFDQAFFNCDTTKLAGEIEALASDFPEFFSGGKNIVFWSAQRTDPLQIELFREAQRVFSEEDALNESLSFSMKHFYYFFPETRDLVFYSYISRLDFQYPVLFADSVCFVALDLYLGPQQSYYQSLPEYLAFYRQPAFMVRDVVNEILKSQLQAPRGSANLLDEMIYHGKKLYALQRMMPHKEKHIIIRYPPDKLAFCQKNERSIWAYFVENNYLFSTSQDLKTRFIELAPFSKFRMKFDHETPGMIGRWLGWQIVEAYMKQNASVTLPELMRENDSQKILKLSGYKPQ